MAVEWLDEVPPEAAPVGPAPRGVGRHAATAGAVAAATLGLAVGFGIGRNTRPDHAAPQGRPAPSPSSAAPVVVSGRVVLQNSYTADGDAASCTGTDTDGDIRPGAVVRLLDDHGAQLAAAQLGPGYPDGDGCRFDFAATVPATTGPCDVEVAGRPGITVAAGSLADVRIYLD